MLRGDRAMVDRLRLWWRGFHESMAELGRAGIWDKWQGWGLGTMFIVTETIIIR